MNMRQMIIINSDIRHTYRKFPGPSIKCTALIK